MLLTAEPVVSPRSKFEPGCGRVPSLLAARGVRERERRAVLQLSLTRVARRGAPPFLASFGLHCAFTRQAHRGGTRRRALVAVAVVVIIVAVVIVVDAAIESVPAAALIRRQAFSGRKGDKSTAQSSRAAIRGHIGRADVRNDVFAVVGTVSEAAETYFRIRGMKTRGRVASACGGILRSLTDDSRSISFRSCRVLLLTRSDRIRRIVVRVTAERTWLGTESMSPSERSALRDAGGSRVSFVTKRGGIDGSAWQRVKVG